MQIQGYGTGRLAGVTALELVVTLAVLALVACVCDLGNVRRGIPAPIGGRAGREESYAGLLESQQ